MRMRLIVEVDYDGTAQGFRAEIRNSMKHGRLREAVPGEIVYVANDIADTAVISHDSRTLTVG